MTGRHAARPRRFRWLRTRRHVWVRLAQMGWR